MYEITLSESGYQFTLTENDLERMSQFGDMPSDWGLEVSDCKWVSVEYAMADPNWDVPEGYPGDLPLWEGQY